MRILYIINNLAKGGAERFVLDVITYLHQNTDIEYRLAVLDDINEYEEYAVETLNLTNIKYVPFSFRRKNRNEKLTQLINEFKPEIIHSNLFLSEFVTGYDVRNNIHYVCHGHDNMHQFAPLTFRQVFDKKKLLNRLDYLVLSFKKYRKVPTYFIANSQHTLAYYSKNVHRKQRKNVRLLQYGFNFANYYAPKTSAPMGKIRMVNVGSFQVKKNQQFFIELARVLKHRGVDFEINLIGHGSEYEAVKGNINSLGLEEYVFLRGLQSNVQEWYQQSDLYIHAATYEPFGLVFLEAMAAGLPVVTLNGKGNRDIIEEDKNGYLLLEPNAEKFADKVIEYTSDSAKYSEMSTYAQEYARQFDASTKTEELIAFYRSLLASA